MSTLEMRHENAKSLKSNYVEIAVAIPMSVLQGLIERLNVSYSDNTERRYYHMVLFAENGGAKCLLSHPEVSEIDVTGYCIRLVP